MAAAVIQFKRGTYAGLPALAAGEPGFSTDFYDFYIGLDDTLGGNKFFGSQRYWDREDGIESAYLNLVDRDGSNKIALKAPNVLAGVTTYVLPATPVAGGLLQSDADGQLSWSSALTQVNLTSLYVTGLSTFQAAIYVSDTTDSYDKDSGSAVFNGGLGVELNTNIGGGLKVGGIGTFVGALNVDDITDSSSPTTGSLVVGGGIGLSRNLYVGAGASIVGVTTISSTVGTTALGEGALDVKGGASVAQNLYVGAGLSVTGETTLQGATSINGNVSLGNAQTDILTITADIQGNLLPEIDGAYNVGDNGEGKNWLNGSFSGIITATSGVQGGAVQVGISSVRTIDTSNGSLFLAGQDGRVVVDGTVNVLANQIVDGNSTIVGSETVSNVQIGVNSTTQVDTSAGNLKLDAATNTIDILAQSNTTGFATFANGAEVTSGGVLVGNIGVGTETNNIISTNSGNLILKSGEVATNVRVEDDLVVTGSIFGSITGSISTATRAQTFDVSGVVDTADRYLTFVETSVTGTGQTAYVAPEFKYNADSTTMTVPIARIGSVKASDGSDAITISDTTGNVSFASSVTITGDITVLGTQTIVNTEALKVEDPLIELGLVNSAGSLIPPTVDQNIDVGVMMHYYTTSAQIAAVFWDESVNRVAVASSVTESANVMTEIAYADLEIGGLWVNDAAGQTQVIRHNGTSRILENITVDGGSF